MLRSRAHSQALLFVLLTSALHLAQGESDPCYIAYGDGSKQTEAERCKAQASAGGPNAEFGYALLLWSGHDRPSDRRSALEWFRKSARQGHYLAQISLGRFLSDATLDPELRNPVEAYAWWVAAGATTSAIKVLATLSTSDASAAKLLGSEYKAKYAKQRPPTEGP
jgi:TPR repeat protein